MEGNGGERGRCLFCWRDLEEEDQKPVVSSSGSDTDLWTEWRGKLECFLKLIGSQDGILKENWSIKLKGLWRLPVCILCNHRLEEVWRIQKLVEELQTSQKVFVEALQAALLANGETEDETGGAGELKIVREQILHCVTGENATLKNCVQPSIKQRPGPASRRNISSKLSQPVSLSANKLADLKDITSCSVVLHRLSTSSIEEATGKPALFPKLKDIPAGSPTRGKRKSALRARQFLKDTLVREDINVTSHNEIICKDENDLDDYIPSPDEDEDNYSDSNPSQDDSYLKQDDLKETAPVAKKGKKVAPFSDCPTSSTRAGHASLNHFWLINDTLLMFQFTPIQVSHGVTKFTCLEPHCTSGTFTNPNYFTLFSQMKTHVSENHRDNYTNTPVASRQCPVCPEEISNTKLIAFRQHLLLHSTKLIVCEICLKPIRHYGTYRDHIWLHRNLQEKAEVGVPRHFVRAAEAAKDDKKIELYRKLGVMQDKPGYATYEMIKPLKTKVERIRKKKPAKPKPVISNKPKKWLGNSLWTHHDSSHDHFGKLQENLLQYKYTLIQIQPENQQQLFCLEPGCTTPEICQGLHWDSLELAKQHVKDFHFNTSDYLQKTRDCPLCLGLSPDTPIYQGPGLKLQKHLRAEHKKQLSWYCQSCGKSIINRRAVKFHMLRHDPDPDPEQLAKLKRAKLLEKRYCCDQCGREFGHPHKLRNHLLVHIPKESRTHLFSCDYCGLMLLSKRALDNHTERKHRPELIRYKYCPICNMQFNYRDGYRYNKHLREHRGEKPFVCHHCGVGFSGSVTLKNHLLTHSEFRKFGCGLCGTRYKERKGLLRHCKKVHGGDLSSELKLEN